MPPIDHPAIKAAIEAALDKFVPDNRGVLFDTLVQHLAPALEQLVTDERKRCATAAKELEMGWSRQFASASYRSGFFDARDCIAAAITGGTP